MRFLVTRPQPDCKATADRLRALGHDAEEWPLLKFRADAPSTFDLSAVGALAFTSRRAVDALIGHSQLCALKELPVFTVGDKTAEACRDLGFKTVQSANSDVRGLAKLILGTRSKFTGDDVLYLAPLDRAGDLAGLLESSSLRCQTVSIYRMDAVDTLPDDVRSAFDQNRYDGVLIFSQRTGKTFTTLLKENGLGHIFSSLPIYAISAQAAESLERFDRIHIADVPREDALIGLVLADC